MVNERFDDDGWPDPQLLAAWHVPSLPEHFADRVLAHAAVSGAQLQPHRDRDRGLATIVAALAAALAVAAVLVLVLATRREPTIAPEPVPMPIPVPAVAVAPPQAQPTPPVHEVAPATIVVIDVTVEPAVAEIRLVASGRELVRGQGSQPFAVNRERNGDVELEVSAPGFLPQQVPVRFSGAPQQSIEVTLVALPPATPMKPISRTPTRTAAAHPDLKDPFHDRGTDDDAGPSPNLKDPFHKAPAPAASRTSTLKIGVLAGRGVATVSVDGHVVGSTPIPNHRVTPGKHRIRWDWDDGHSFEQTIVIASGEVMMLKGS